MKDERYSVVLLRFKNNDKYSYLNECVSYKFSIKYLILIMNRQIFFKCMMICKIL